jgi:lysophospholipase L1-like esterase
MPLTNQLRRLDSRRRRILRKIKQSPLLPRIWREPIMKTLLCFGDSNTWGADPATQSRFPLGTAWPAILRAELGPDYLVIDEGLPGRTTVWEDPIEGYKNGKSYLIPCLASHNPIDLVIIMLGTNDLKARFSVSAYDIANSAGTLVEEVYRSKAGRDGRAPQALLMAPPPLAPLGEYRWMFEGGEAKSARFGTEYARVAKLLGCHFLDAGSVIVSSAQDGIHFDAPEHAKLGRAVASKVRALLG